jgi:polo-like kinase 1
LAIENNENILNEDEQEVYVKKWVDYSVKYGVGYLLSNGNTGVFFNDYTKIIYNPKTNYFEYMERQPNQRQDKFRCYYLNSYPKDLSKKVTLLIHFKGYLESTKTQPSQPDDNAEEVPVSMRLEPMVYLKKVMKTRNAQLLRLSNKIVQVVFSDKTEIILSSESRLVTYVDKEG